MAQLNTINQMIREFERVLDSDQFRISARGACLVAALDYEATFGKDVSGKSPLVIADEMAARIA
jgi:hypothetical protein